MYLKYLKSHGQEFLKSIGNVNTSSYKDWVNQENKLNEIYDYIVTGGRTFRHTKLEHEAFISPCTTDQSIWQFTMFDESGKPFGHAVFSALEELSRGILDKGYYVTNKVNILN